MPKIISKSKKKFAGMVLGTLVMSTAPTHALAVCPPYAEKITLAATVAAKAALQTFVDQIFQAFTDQLNFFSQIKIGSLKVVTNQVALAAKVQIKAQQAVGTAEMSAMSYLESSKAQMEVFRQFSPQTGQGADPCGQMRVQQAAIAAASFVQGQAGQYMSSLTVTSGKFGNPDSHAKKILKERFDNFASADERKINNAPAASTVIDKQGNQISLDSADTNAATLFAESDDPRIKTAKANYIAYLSGSPDAPITKDTAATPAGQQYLDEKYRKDALLSVGQHSLATVAAENDPDHELGDQSMMSAMNDMASFAFGSVGRQVQQIWTTQSERGLALDGLKMASSSLAMEVSLLEQALRTESLIAALVSQESKGLQTNVDIKAAELVKQLHQSPVE